jgi:hypothetical protein
MSQGFSRGIPLVTGRVSCFDEACQVWLSPPLDLPPLRRLQIP